MFYSQLIVTFIVSKRASFLPRLLSEVYFLQPFRLIIDFDPRQTEEEAPFQKFLTLPRRGPRGKLRMLFLEGNTVDLPRNSIPPRSLHVLSSTGVTTAGCPVRDQVVNVGQIPKSKINISKSHARPSWKNTIFRPGYDTFPVLNVLLYIYFLRITKRNWRKEK